MRYLSKTVRDKRGVRRATGAVRAVTLVAVIVAVGVRGQEQPSRGLTSAQTNHQIARRLRLVGVPNFGEVIPTLYRGGQPTKEGFRNLAHMGIKIVVDLRGSRASERRLVTKLGMQYVALPWRCYLPRDKPFAQFLLLIRENPGKKIFVHCKVGDDRTGMDIAAYRMAEQGWTPEEAEKEMAAYGATWFHRRICPGLASYENNFPKRFETSPAFEELRDDKAAPEGRRQSF